MSDAVFRFIAGFICITLLLLPAVSSPPSVEDSASEVAMLPPCDVESGVPFVQEDQVTCYWGMSEETLSLPEIIDTLNVEIKISWEKQGTWIGIAEASEAQKCTQQDGYYECEKNSVTLIEVDDLSQNSFVWNAESGEYRFVAGGDDTQSLQEFEVNWEYEATLDTSSTLYIATGIVFGIYAALGIQGFKRLLKFKTES